MKTAPTIITTISNPFTGYRAEIRTRGRPAFSTIMKHLRRAKAKECLSTTYIFIDGAGYDYYHGELLKNGAHADI